MVQFLAGLKGEGKTRIIIDMANENAKSTDGSLVFIDDDSRHIHNINRDIRLVEAGKGRLSSCRGLTYFIWGMLTQNADIQHVYVDGITTIVRDEPSSEDLVKFKKALDKLSSEFNTDITISMHCDRDSLPNEVKEVLL